MPRRIGRRRALVTLAGAAVAPSLGCIGPAETMAREPARRRKTAAAPPPDPDASRVVRRISSMPAVDGDGAHLQRVFPSPQLRHLDPFVLLDDFNVGPPAGFPRHPHRGFEAFTYMLEGAFEHKDSMGNESRVTAGGTQRFLSGRGAYHSEMPGTNGPNRGLQLWVNLPRRLKKIAPEYQESQSDALPRQSSAIHRVRSVSGGGSPVAFRTDVDYLDVELLADGGFDREIDGGRNTLLYVIEGEVQLGGETVARGSGVLLSEGKLHVAGGQGARFVYLSGRPHGEPIIHRGPFVD